ncbi:MAG: hypothetical protein M3R38_22705 [Actinomycetota bacterium]|nr:hypothetical protein [Actinomycetota bacterium]
MTEMEASGRVVLGCCSCGERTILLGSTGDWYREEGRSTFFCGGCERELRLADRVGEVHLDTAGLAFGPG